MPRSGCAGSPWDYWDFGGSHIEIPSQQTLKENIKCETFFFFLNKLLKSAVSQFDTSEQITLIRIIAVTVNAINPSFKIFLKYRQILIK